MERELDDVNKVISSDDLNEMEERRITSLNEAGIDETEVLEQAHKHLNTWNSYFNENITRGKDDMNFTLRDQWTAVERSEFTRLFKPAMTFNKLYDPVKKTVGEQRKNKPDLIVRSLTGKASQAQLDLRGDLVRTISYQSQNDLVYQTAFKSALLMGFGAFQIVVDYESPRSFNKVIRYEALNDATRASWDPVAIKPHKGDGNFCSRNYVYSRDEFFATYPYVTNPVSYVDPYMLLDFQWTTRDTIVVCDYFVKEWYPIKMLLLEFANGDKISVDEIQWEKLQKKIQKQEEIVEGAEVARIIQKEKPRIIMEKQTQDYQIMQYRMIQDQIIDFSIWPSKHLPIIFVDGDSYYIEGRQYTRSLIHEARDAQKLLNYSRSELAAELKNRRREQWIGTPDNIIGYEQDWRNPELQVAMLRAKPDPRTGQLPQKMPAWEINQGLFVTAQSTTQDIREIVGYSETEQLNSRDMSGKAKRERKMEASMSTYVYFDNLNQAVEQGGRVVNDLLPHIIGENERTMVLTKKNGQSERITFNQPNKKTGEIENIIEDGDFDVEIDAGPSFAVQKEMALEMFTQTIQAFPQAFPLIADLWAANLDLQHMPQIKERFKTMVPPAVIAKEEGKQLPPQPPSPQEQMMRMEMENKKQEIVERAEEIKNRRAKLELEQKELLLKAAEMQQRAQAEHHDRILEREKSDLDFTSAIAKLLADTHKSEGKRAKEEA